MKASTFSTLPDAVRYRLLCASTGKHHLIETAQTILAGGESDPERGAALLGLAKELYLAAWLTDPLDPVVTADLKEFEQRMPTLGPEASQCVKGAAGLLGRELDPSLDVRLRRLEGKGDYPALADWLLREIDNDPGNGRLAWALYHHAVENGDFMKALHVANNLAGIRSMAPLAARLKGDVLFLDGEYDAALVEYGQAGSAFAGFGADREGEAHYRAGRKGAAEDVMRAGLERMPWMTQLLLRLHDIGTGVDSAREPLDGTTALLLYSYNNADQLNQTLDSLYGSLTGQGSPVIVRVLSNGSTDDTARILATWKDRFGDGFDTIALPVNVGAPAARNWLMHLPEVGACDFAAYMDDDVRLPEDWLERLGAARAAYPDAAVWGCRVVDHERIHNLQQTDLNLLEPRPGDERFSMTEAHVSARDFGQFSYLRPATSVTGCCHLFKTDALRECGDFDLRFSPTQYDDLDHDLRLGNMNTPVIYQGHLGVEHMKLTGRAATMTPAAMGNARGNLYKLRRKHGQHDLDRIRTRMLAVLEEDRENKACAIGGQE